MDGWMKFKEEKRRCTSEKEGISTIQYNTVLYSVIDSDVMYCGIPIEHLDVVNEIFLSR